MFGISDNAFANFIYVGLDFKKLPQNWIFKRFILTNVKQNIVLLVQTQHLSGKWVRVIETLFLVIHLWVMILTKYENFKKEEVFYENTRRL